MEDCLDLHTFRPAEAHELVNEYLRAAHAAGLTSVRIIHGKGTGRLRAGVHQVLGTHPLVRSFANAPDYLGGWGATVVNLGERQAPIEQDDSETRAPGDKGSKRERALALYMRWSPLASMAVGVLMVTRMRTDYEQVRWLLIAAGAGLFGWFAERHVRRLGAVSGFTTRLLFTNTCWFLLPFYLRSTAWSAPGHVLSVGLLGLLTLIWELNKAAARIETLPTGRAAMRSLTVFFLLNMALPTVAQASLDTAWWSASAVAASLYLSAGFSRVAHPWMRRTAVLPLLIFLTVVWRPWFPPVPMWLADSRFDWAAPDPVTASPATLTLNTAVVAPQGLHERLEHVWVRRGRVTDRVALDITGGRTEGFRTRSRKRKWPVDAAGTWRVEVRTIGGRLLGTASYKRP